MSDIHWSVVLVRTEGPVNLGLIARLCGNMGLDDLRLVDPQCEPDQPDSRRFSVSSKPLLLAAPRHSKLDEAVADSDLVIGTSARPRGHRHGRVHSLSEIHGVIAERKAKRIALVFGNEAKGLDTEELSRCQILLSLETPGDHESYNLSHAVAIILYQLLAAKRPEEAIVAEGEAPADAQSLARLERYLLGTLDRFGYFRRTTKDRYAIKLRSMLLRLRLLPRDVQLLFGMLAQLNYKVHGDKGHHLIEEKDGEGLT